MANTLDRDQLFSFAKTHRDEYEALLKRFVETPTVSCDPSHAEDIRKGVDLTVETLRRFGGDVKVYEVDERQPHCARCFWHRQELAYGHCLQSHGRAAGFP